MQDGAGAHTAHNTRNFLNSHFPRRWIGKYGPIAWAANSPDLNVCDFFAWGYGKNRVYADTIDNVAHLRQSITQEFQAITPEMCRRAVRNAFERFEICYEIDGGHVENYM